MSVKQKIHGSEGIFFITFTCFNWLSLFEITNTYDAVYNWFNILKLAGHNISGYVIMPNHVHLLAEFVKQSMSLDKIIGNGKRFIAYKIIKELTKVGRPDLLAQLSDGVELADRKRGKLHEVFKDSFDCKECFTEKFVKQKLNYIHSNPCVGKWQLASCPEEYLHSSAKYYTTGEQGVFSVTHIMELLM